VTLKDIFRELREQHTADIEAMARRLREECDIRLAALKADMQAQLEQLKVAVEECQERHRRLDAAAAGAKLAATPDQR
jgi:hypothetical protein